MEVIYIAAFYLVLFTAGVIYFFYWNSRPEDHSSVDNAWKAADQEKQRQASFWTQQFQEAVDKHDTAKILSLCTTEIKVLGDEANTLTRLTMKVDNSLYHLRYRALELEKLTKLIIIGTVLLSFATLPLAVESTAHLLEPFQAPPALRVTFPAPHAPEVYRGR